MMDLHPSRFAVELSQEQIRFGAHKSPRPSDEDLSAIRARSLNMLARCLNLRTTVAVVGAGCSIPRGYVSWRDFTEQFLRRTILHLGGPGQARTATLERMLKELAAEKECGSPVDPGNLMYFVGVCKRAILQAERYSDAKRPNKDAFSDCFEKLFKGRSAILGVDFKEKGKLDESRYNPYEKLLSLPIRRFVTTNYDEEIEDAFANRKQEKSVLTQEDRHTDKLARFALAEAPDGDGKPAVFHCHGSVSEPGSIIAGEADYQRWYLGRRKSVGSVFRQTIELLFESNPLLFVGYGLSDEDLLRPLRTLGAVDPSRKISRPIFAIMGRKSRADDYRLHQYYERYGLHIITYDSTGDVPRGQAFCDVLDEVYDVWVKAQDEWVLKPPPRKVTAVRDAEKGLPPTNWLPDEGIGVPLGRDSDVDELRQLLEGDDSPALVGFLGPSGCGKTRKIRRLMGQLRQADRRGGADSLRQLLGRRSRVSQRYPDGFFYWNGHYVNEGLTGIDQFLDFLGSESDSMSSTPRDQRLAALLRTKRALVVLDGAERLFRPSGKALVGEPISGYIRGLLEVLAARGNKTTIVLSGRLWPECYQEALGDDSAPLDCAAVRASRVRQDDLVRFVRAEGFDDIERLLERNETAIRQRLSGLCSLLDGHNYGLLLALEWIRQRLPNDDRESEDVEAWSSVFDDLRRRLTEERLGNRVWSMIGLTVQDLVARYDPFVRAFLRQMAFSLSALSPTSLRLIFDLTASSAKPRVRAQTDFEAFLLALKDRHMLVEMPRPHERIDADEGRVGRAETKIYAVHSKVRSYFYGNEGSPDESLPSLGVSELSSGGFGVDPMPHQDEVRSLVMRLVDEGTRYLGEGERKLASDVCRDAYSILRGRLEANTAPRWCGYASYSEIGIHLVRLAKAIGGQRQWDHRDSFDRATLEDWSGALFLGELAWLYNDVGVALLGEGLAADAYSVWEQAFEIHRLIEEDDLRGGLYQIQGLLNLSGAFLELGRIQSAREYLARAEQMNRFLGDEFLEARIQGLSGLIQHLNGNLRAAKRLYNQALRRLKRSDDLRARSFFHKYRADLNRSQGQMSEAEADIRAARIAADEGKYPDLAIEALMSRGHFESTEERWADARLHFEAALRASKRIQSPRLQSAVLCNLARLSLDQRDAGSARYHALRSLKIANEYRLGLRVSHSLVVLGKATLDAGHRDLGVAYLRNAQKLASRQQYWYRAREAEMKLQELGVEEEPSASSL